MDRFIVIVLLMHLRIKTNLKSNMDRFIAKQQIDVEKMKEI